jgi:hypothetical protein
MSYIEVGWLYACLLSHSPSHPPHATCPPPGRACRAFGLGHSKLGARHDQRHGFAVFHAPTGANPFLPVEAIAALRAELPRPEVALQELDAQFVDTGGATIFPLAALTPPF